MPLQDQTKGDNTAPIVPANGAITTKIPWATAAIVRRALHPKDTSQHWAVGRTTGGHHSVHGG
jgi:hypothetical protein